MITMRSVEIELLPRETLDPLALLTELMAVAQPVGLGVVEAYAAGRNRTDSITPEVLERCLERGGRRYWFDYVFGRRIKVSLWLDGRPDCDGGWDDDAGGPPLIRNVRPFIQSSEFEEMYGQGSLEACVRLAIGASGGTVVDSADIEPDLHFCGGCGVRVREHHESVDGLSERLLCVACSGGDWRPRVLAAIETAGGQISVEALGEALGVLPSNAAMALIKLDREGVLRRLDGGVFQTMGGAAHD